MGYNEGREEAFMYYDLGKSALERGNIGEARSNLNHARAIAVENKMYNLIRLIDDTLDDLKTE